MRCIGLLVACALTGWLSCFVTVASLTGSSAPSKEAKTVWDYVKVREDAYMFWWLYFTSAKGGYLTKPLVMWLQGGPGGSSTGFGNFMEIGPQDINQNYRNTTWLNQVSLLFVDNPVGTGFSYVTDKSAYTRDNKAIAKDLVTMMKSFLRSYPDFQKVPFYVFSESYGGKMTAGFAQELYNAIQNGDVKCNFKGFAMGDSWISPLDSVLTWGPYLYGASLVAEQGLNRVNSAAEACQKSAMAGNWSQSTAAWNTLETVVEEVTNGVNFYNILKWGAPESSSKSVKAEETYKENTLKQHLKNLYHRHVKVHDQMSLSQFMNGPIRDKLKIIPKNVTWGGQSAEVFDALSEDFMKSVTDVVDTMLNTDLQVVVYSGQLDLIVDTLGTERWVQALKWDKLANYNKAPRKPFYSGEMQPSNMAGYVKEYKNFSFYWVLNAGHMVPSDAGNAALQLLRMVTKS